MVQVGAIAVIVIPLLSYGTTWIDDWRAVRASLGDARTRLKDLEVDQARQAGLLAIVPVCEEPQPEETQKFLFREKLHEQLKKAGINTQPLQILTSRKMKSGPYKVLKIQCKGKCRFEQLLDLLAGLKENPYLVGVEELRIQCDTRQPPEKRKEIEIDLTVSTFVKREDAESEESRTDEVRDGS
jgi:hypothetical protein